MRINQAITRFYYDLQQWNNDDAPHALVASYVDHIFAGMLLTLNGPQFLNATMKVCHLPKQKRYAKAIVDSLPTHAIPHGALPDVVKTLILAVTPILKTSTQLKKQLDLPSLFLTVGILAGLTPSAFADQCMATLKTHTGRAFLAHRLLQHLTQTNSDSLFQDYTAFVHRKKAAQPFLTKAIQPYDATVQQFLYRDQLDAWLLIGFEAALAVPPTTRKQIISELSPPVRTLQDNMLRNHFLTLVNPTNEQILTKFHITMGAQLLPLPTSEKLTRGQVILLSEIHLNHAFTMGAQFAQFAHPDKPVPTKLPPNRAKLA